MTSLDYIELTASTPWSLFQYFQQYCTEQCTVSPAGSSLYCNTSNYTYQLNGEVNTSPPRQNGHHFAEDIFRCIFLNENAWIFIMISLNFVPKGSINNIPALVQIMAWRRRGDKPLSEPIPTWFTGAYMRHQGEMSQHIEAETTWLLFCRPLIQMHFLIENIIIWIQISLKLIPKVPIDNIPALV